MANWLGSGHDRHEEGRYCHIGEFGQALFKSKTRVGVVDTAV